MSSVEKLKKGLKEFGLAHKAEELLPLAKESIRMMVNQIPEEKIQIGGSKVGGCPDVPSNFSWPHTNDNRPLYFLCQLNLAQIKAYDTNSLLPADGLLSFFYDAVEQPWGYDPKDYDGFKVFFFSQETSSLNRKEIPVSLYEHGNIDGAALQFKNEMTLPSWDSPYSMYLEEILSEEEADSYRDFEYEWMEEDDLSTATHRIDGYPDAIQGDMYLECQLVTNGLYCGDSTGYNDPLRKELEAGATDWRLLLQFDTEDDLGLMWGDSGRLYFWIREEDCKNKQFDKAWVVLQCF